MALLATGAVVGAIIGLIVSLDRPLERSKLAIQGGVIGVIVVALVFGGGSCVWFGRG